MSDIRVTIPGDPVAQPRPRFSGKGKFVRVYTPKKHPVNKYKTDIAETIIMNWDKTRRAFPVIDKPNICDLTVIFKFRKPSGVRKAITDHYKKPDADNLIKAVMDAMTGIVYEDDSQVSRLNIVKVYGDTAETEIRIREVENGKM